MITALLLNIVIFMLIQRLVTNEHKVNSELENINLVELISLKPRPEPPEPEAIEALDRPPPEKQPPPLAMPEPTVEKPQTAAIDLPLPEIDIPLSLSGTPYLGDFIKSAAGKSAPVAKFSTPEIDTNVVPTLRIPPIYPPRALRSGIEGMVTVEFTIAADGSVTEPVIVKADPPDIFDKAVLKAILKWKYNPDTVDGKPTEKRASQDIKFKLRR